VIRILLVEDEPEKTRLIVAAAGEVPGVDLKNFDIAADVVTAKRYLARTKYDLMILDINIPPRADRPIEVGAGLEVLRFVRSGGAHAPAHIVGMTAYDDGFAKATSAFSSPLWKLIKFGYEEGHWREPLKAAVQYLVETHGAPYVNDGTTYHTDLGIVVALDDEELRSVRDLDGDWERVNVRHDNLRYFTGKFRRDKKSVAVVAVAAPRMGMPPATVAATKLIEAFRPRYLAITGICAGVRRKTRIGDILVADPCWDWGSGKWVRQKPSGTRKFLPASYQWRLDEHIRSAVKELGADDAMLAEIHASWSGRKPKRPPRVLVDAMASGASVLGGTRNYG
jgi:CheY-like chemotaxis protein